MKYKHFWGDYRTIDVYQYRRTTRIVRPGGVVKSVGDAYGFARSSDERKIDEKSPELWRYAKGYVYHYGWVKSLQELHEKANAAIEWYHSGKVTQSEIDLLNKKELVEKKYFIMKDFKESHPSVMLKRVSSFPVLAKRRSRWLNPSFYFHVLRHGFKG